MMWYHVDQYRVTDVSEKLAASSASFTDPQKMQAPNSSETQVIIYPSTRCHIKDLNFYHHCYEQL